MWWQLLGKLRGTEHTSQYLGISFFCRILYYVRPYGRTSVWLCPFPGFCYAAIITKIMDLLKELAAYRPWNEQEEQDQAELLRRLHGGEELYSRDNASAHLTASA